MMRHTPIDALGTVEGFAGPAHLRWDGGGQALIPPGELASEPPPPTCEGSALA